MRPRPVLLGHRGARAQKSIPENTLASFDQALADGCDGFEFDVHLTADGEAVVCHDPNSGHLEIARTTAKQLPSLPRLHDVLARYHHAFLDIELKVAGLDKIVVALLKQRRRERFVVSSFLPQVLESVHDADRAIPLGLICETTEQLRHWNRIPTEYLMPHHTLLHIQARNAKASGRKILVWTVNDVAEMKRCAEWGVAGIISDDTKSLCRTFGA